MSTAQELSSVKESHHDHKHEHAHEHEHEHEHDHDHEEEHGHETPEGVRLLESDGAVTLSVRAGGFGWGLMAAVLLAVIWSLFWAVGLVEVIGAPSNGEDVSASIFVHAVASFVGVYCFALCLWIMLGRERVVIGGGRLRTSSPWRFGMLSQSYDLRAVQSFATQHTDCGPEEGGGCCCKITNEPYPLTFGSRGHRVPVFSHLPNDAKDWIRDRLNAVLKLKGAPTAHSCECGHRHAH